MNTKTMKVSWFKTMAAAFAASVMATGAQGAEKITVDEVSNHYPWDGKVDCVTTLSGLETSGYEYKGAFTLSVKKDGTKVSKAVTNDFASTDGTYTNTFDCAALFGAGLYPSGGIAVDLVREKQLCGVQLWENGPYWAECNVGATKPEEYGYYFWWGDTVGYTNTGSAWISVKDGTTLSAGFSDANCATYGKDNDALLSEGYIDSMGNLVAEHDAATAHLGGSWRMPTDAEFANLTNKCSWTWTGNWNGKSVAGYVVTGKTAGYTDKSIFLPAAGNGDGFGGLSYTGSCGHYWSSTPTSVSYIAWGLSFYSGGISRYYYARNFGRSVRPLRGFAQ